MITGDLKKARYSSVTKGGAIVLRNGDRVYNRPMYMNHMPVVAMAGDRPALRLIDGKNNCGTVLLACLAAGKGKWLHDFKEITTFFYPNRTIWKVTDPLFPGLIISMAAVPLSRERGMAMRLHVNGPVSFLVMHGGLEGNDRDNQFNAHWVYDPLVNKASTLQPFDTGLCRNDKVEILPGSYRISSGSKDKIWAAVSHCEGIGEAFAGNAAAWENPLSLRPENNPDLPVACLKVSPNAQGDTCFIVIGESPENSACPEPDYPAAKIRRMFTDGAGHAKEIARQIQVKTPDQHFNAAVGFSCAAMDAAYDTTGYVHGAMAWNHLLPGWRSLYGPTAYGWHTFVKQHGHHYLQHQNEESDLDTPHPDEQRLMTIQSERSILRGKGYINRDQHMYNFQTQLFDMLVHALRWTGDIELLEWLKTALPLHLEWQRACFDPDGNGVYESYINTFFTDSVWYNGGETVHETAYAYAGNRAMACIAEKSGDGHRATDYRKRAKQIKQNLKKSLWIRSKGYFAEYREALGLRRCHEDASLNSIFLPIDAGLLTAKEAAQALYYTRWGLERVPSELGGERCWSTNWVPHIWSTREIYPGDLFHLALSFFQTGLIEEGWILLQGTLRETAFNQLVPGTVGDENTATDFTDCTSPFGRLVVEGVFGFRPDYLSGQVCLMPCLPPEWEHASIRTPDFQMSYQRNGCTDRWRIELMRKAKIRFSLPVRKTGIGSVRLNGECAVYRLEPGPGSARILVDTETEDRFEVLVDWQGESLPAGEQSVQVTVGQQVELDVDDGQVLDIDDPQGVFGKVIFDEHKIHGRIAGLAGQHMAFALIRKGDISLWQMLKISVTDPVRERLELEKSALPIIQQRAVWRLLDLGSVMNGDIRTLFQQQYLSPRVKTCSTQLGIDGFSPWTFTFWEVKPPQISLSSVPSLLSGDRLQTPQCIPFKWNGYEKNSALTSQYDRWPGKVQITVGLQGRAIFFSDCRVHEPNADKDSQWCHPDTVRRWPK